MSDDRRAAYERLNNAIDLVGEVPCQSLPEVFFPDDFFTKDMKQRATRTAQQLCATCPVRLACFEYATIAEEPFGVWAGTLPSER
jgi:hypothetical protein